MIDKEKVYNNLKYIDSMIQYGASPNLDEYWDEIVNELSKDINETEKFLNECNEKQIFTMAGYFEDVAYNLQNREFINILERIQKKFPDIDLTKDIQWAKDTIEE